MPSKQSEAVRDYWRSATEAAGKHPNRTPAEVRERVEKYWPALTAEPGGLDYLEVEVADLPALWAVPKGAAEDRVILSVHGGGGVSESIYTHRKLFGHLAKATGARALLTEYSPLHYPAPVEDTTAAYRWLLDQGADAGHIAVAGDSLGGGLAIATVLRARDLGLPTAAALMLISPWVDMTVSNENFQTNRKTEAFFYKEVVEALASVYLAGADPKDPLASPLYADLSGLPPTCIQVGGDETLLGESLQLEQNARTAGVDVQAEVFPGQQHTFQMAAGYAPESDDAIRSWPDGSGLSSASPSRRQPGDSDPHPGRHRGLRVPLQGGSPLWPVPDRRGQRPRRPSLPQTRNRPGPGPAVLHPEPRSHPAHRDRPGHLRSLPGPVHPDVADGQIMC